MFLASVTYNNIFKEIQILLDNDFVLSYLSE